MHWGRGTAMRSAEELDASWRQDERWAGIARPYRPEDIVRLRGSVGVEHTLARIGAERLWSLFRSDVPVTALGALTGNQAIQQVHAGLTAIYLSGWQVAADANDAGQMYPDQSLYPADSVPNVVRRVNNAFIREDEKQTAVGEPHVNGFAPIIADGEAGFGGPLNALELMKALIEAGAAAVHFEDQLASAKKCGHLGGKVLVSTGVFLQKLVAARLAADLCDVPTVLIARTDANSAKLITTDVDPRDQPFIVDAERTTEGFHRFRGGIDASIARGVAYAPYADLVRCEGGRLPRVRAPVVRRDRVLRRNHPGDHRRRCFDPGDGGFHGEGAVPGSRREGRTGCIVSASTERLGDWLNVPAVRRAACSGRSRAGATPPPSQETSRSARPRSDS